MNGFEILKERGFIEQMTHEAEIKELFDKERVTFYIGYDPTASSLTVGHFLTVMAMSHLQKAGHRPIVLMGGGTGMIGDPSGKTEMRQLLAPEQIQRNLQALRGQIGRYVDLSEGRGLMVNNADWLLELNYIAFLRDIGRHFSVNRMLAAEAYRTRLEAGLSFIEFNYQLLQAYDFLHLYREHGCVLQMGGNDQWGNILAGVELIRRVEGGEAFALTFPLLTTSSGAKMGKSAQGAVWLDAEMLSPYDFYQFWINTEDADVERFLRIYTFLPLEEIERLGRLQGAEIRQAKEVLAYEVTRLTHGAEEADKAREASRSLFGAGEASEVMPTSEVEASRLQAGIPAVELFAEVGLANSRSEARRLIQQGGAYLNGEPVDSPDAVVTADALQDGALVLRAGKKRYHRVVVAE